MVQLCPIWRALLLWFVVLEWTTDGFWICPNHSSIRSLDWHFSIISYFNFCPLKIQITSLFYHWCWFFYWQQNHQNIFRSIWTNDGSNQSSLFFSIAFRDILIIFFFVDSLNKFRIMFHWLLFFIGLSFYLIFCEKSKKKVGIEKNYRFVEKRRRRRRDTSKRRQSKNVGKEAHADSFLSSKSDTKKVSVTNCVVIIFFRSFSFFLLF